ncbi:MAG TPA: DUF2203 domain-containing protein [Candidatus Limnocylindrales bacterium]|jgi:hypothetical protein|nr:DUF2203 domain-containing protein [Candidatus Limnocylindrales bacterium]
MSRFFDVDAANEALTEVAPLLATLSDQRSELIRLRDQTLAAHAAASSGGGPGIDEGEAQRIRLRMQGIVDQMAAAVARIDALGITLRDIERGLIDFPALAAGRQVFLCWELGETVIAFWHDVDTGYGSRRPLIELA